jgi:hypothetical protein
VANGTTVQADDNLIPGQSYTFTFDLGNWLSLPSENSVLAELGNYAPDFIGNARVVQSSGLGLFTNYYNVTFTYTGDGSDVASEVAAAMVSAFAQGGDKFSLASMAMGTAGQSFQTDVSAIATGAGKTVGDAVGGVVQGATSNVSFDVVLVFAVVIGAAVLLFELGGVSGLKRSLA